jgi:heavy metal sensor kinase
MRYPALVLTTGLSLSAVHVTLRSLALALLGLSIGLWLTVLTLGRWLSRRALAPLSDMAAAARDMGAADLSQRLPDPATGDELASLHAAFNGLLNRLQEAFERQGQFTGNASHQLRTPLTALLGQVELALRRDRPAEEYRRTLAVVQTQAAHLHRMVEALLFLARADADAELVGTEVVDLAVWLPQHLHNWATHPRSTDLRVHLAEAAKCVVKAPPVLFGQLLDNLLDNAFKYSTPGSFVTITVASRGENVELMVEDAGAGLPAEELEHIFEPFYRTAAARRDGRPGVGLGLAVARRIATALGGSLHAASELGKGSAFALRLPRTAEVGG